MADSTREPGLPTDADGTHVTPRWVKVFAAIAIVLVVMVVIMVLSGGNHGPGRHAGIDGTYAHSAGIPSSSDATSRKP